MLANVTLGENCRFFKWEFIYFRLFYKQLAVNVFNKSCRGLDSNPSPFKSQATTLSTVPQPLPTCRFLIRFTYLSSVFQMRLPFNPVFLEAGKIFSQNSGLIYLLGQPSPFDCFMMLNI